MMYVTFERECGQRILLRTMDVCSKVREMHARTYKLRISGAVGYRMQTGSRKGEKSLTVSGGIGVTGRKFVICNIKCGLTLLVHISNSLALLYH